MSRFSGRSIIFKSLESLLSEEQIRTLGTRSLVEAERHFDGRPFHEDPVETAVFDATLEVEGGARTVAVRIVVVRREEFQLDAYIGLKEEVIGFFEEEPGEDE
jgi:hypothetical protein